MTRVVIILNLNWDGLRYSNQGIKVVTIDEYLGGGDLSKGADNKSLVKSRRELKSTVCQ